MEKAFSARPDVVGVVWLRQSLLRPARSSSRRLSLIVGVSGSHVPWLCPRHKALRRWFQAIDAEKITLRNMLLLSPASMGNAMITMPRHEAPFTEEPISLH